MRVLLAHNHYGDYAVGGEGIVYDNEIRLLRKNGIEVETFERTNWDLKSYSLSIDLLVHLGYSKNVYNEVRKIIKIFHPDIIHVHNYKYVFSIAIFEAAKDEGVPIVLSLHNYRLICPGGQLRRGVEVCEECLQKNPIRSLWRKGCASSFKYRVAQYCFYCQTRTTILKDVDAFVIPTEFGKQKLIMGGFPENKLFVKPYFLFEPSKELERANVRTLDILQGLKRIGAIFVGRLADEKGVSLLLEAWRGIDFPLTVVGDGPLRNWVRDNAPNNVRLLGECSHEQTLKLLGLADFMVFPSVCHEGLGMTLLEACSVGTPIIASDLGGRREVVDNGKNGLLFEAGSCEDFRDKVYYMVSNREKRLLMGIEARRLYEKLFTPEVSFQQTMRIYEAVLGK